MGAIDVTEMAVMVKKSKTPFLFRPEKEGPEGLID